VGRDCPGEVVSRLCLSLLGLWWVTGDGTVDCPSLEGHGSLRIRLPVALCRVSGRCSCSCHGTSCQTCPWHRWAWHLWACLRSRPDYMVRHCRCDGFETSFAMVIDSVEPIDDPGGFCLVCRGPRAVCRLALRGALPFPLSCLGAASLVGRSGGALMSSVLRGVRFMYRFFFSFAASTTPARISPMLVYSQSWR
jgi:hypothetical protein